MCANCKPIAQHDGITVYSPAGANGCEAPFEHFRAKRNQSESIERVRNWESIDESNYARTKEDQNA